MSHKECVLFCAYNRSNSYSSVLRQIPTECISTGKHRYIDIGKISWTVSPPGAERVEVLYNSYKVRFENKAVIWNIFHTTIVGMLNRTDTPGLLGLNCPTPKT